MARTGYPSFRPPHDAISVAKTGLHPAMAPFQADVLDPGCLPLIDYLISITLPDYGRAIRPVAPAFNTHRAHVPSPVLRARTVFKCVIKW